jgi:predicted DNA-binding protein (UPF0251 family)
MMPATAFQGELMLRFQSKHESPADGCWNWKAGLHGSGRNSYGTFWLEGKMQRSHRVAYRLFCGAIPDGLVVRHRCDNPRCVRPDHLELGTVADNNRDKATRNRAPRVTGDRHGRHTKPERTARGSRHGCAKLTEDQARAIRAMRSAGNTQQAVACQFGVSRRTVQFIERGITWKTA